MNCFQHRSRVSYTYFLSCNSDQPLGTSPAGPFVLAGGVWLGAGGAGWSSLMSTSHWLDSHICMQLFFGHAPEKKPPALQGNGSGRATVRTPRFAPHGACAASRAAHGPADAACGARSGRTSRRGARHAVAAPDIRWNPLVVNS